MPTPEYILKLRKHIGNDLLVYGAVAGVIKNPEGEVLFQFKGEKEGWGLPAGIIEPGESPASTMIREAYEETGLHIEPAKVIGVFGGQAYRHIYPNGDLVEPTIIMFQCKVKGGDLNPIDPETVALQYFSKETMPIMKMPYPSKVIFDDLAEVYFDTH